MRAPSPPDDSPNSCRKLDLCEMRLLGTLIDCPWLMGRIQALRMNTALASRSLDISGSRLAIFGSHGFIYGSRCSIVGTLICGVFQRRVLAHIRTLIGKQLCYCKPRGVAQCEWNGPVFPPAADLFVLNFAINSATTLHIVPEPPSLDGS